MELPKLSKTFAYRPKSKKALSYREKLDLVLFALRNHNEPQRLGGLQVAVKIRFGGNLDANEFNRVIDKLLKDGFIIKMTEDYYSITLDGYYFVGYVAANKNHRRKNRLLSFREWTLAIGTALAGLYGLFEITKWCYHHFQWMHSLKFWP